MMKLGKFTNCRSCSSGHLDVFVDFGLMPLADRMLTTDQLQEPEPFFPLAVAYCHECTLAQITKTVDPELLFDTDYPYFSSFSETLLEHSRR